ncbi:MAG: CDP-diacylglycerol--glycerol-3-phosphate 3-phosphatidyltransferase [Clostridiales bacterium]|nr:CDP-diacylglycerol--glycerol-3-phosphate 3-phosphatidyltransferase [Clostridiales bacterium]
MNLPNRITLFRVFMIPVFLIFYLSDPLYESYGKLIALIIFIIASASDALDGHIARKYNLVTNFGKLMDPLADKLLVAAALVALTSRGVLPAWVTVLIISREFVITGLRQLALEQNIVIAASFWAKLKTVSQMIMIVYLLAAFPESQITVIIKWLLIIITAALTVLSAVEYTVKNKGVLK